MKIYDHDELRGENLAPSFAARQWIGFNKAQAVVSKIYQETHTEVSFMPEAYNGQKLAARVAIIATDTIASRVQLWKTKHHIEGLDMIIDARMGRDQGGIYVWREGDDPAAYERSLSRTPMSMPCGQKATAPLSVGLVPGLVGIVMMRYVNGLKIPYSMFSKVLLPEMFISVDMN